MKEVASTPKVSGEELRHELEQVLSHHYGAPRRVRHLHRRRSTYSSSYTIENLEVQLDHGKCLSLVFKDLSPGSILKTAQQIRPWFMYHPQREIETYHSILSSQRLGTPLCYGAVQRPEIQRYWLFLERVDGPLLWQAGRIDTWKHAARWLARLHSRFLAEKGSPQAADLNGCRAWPRSLLRYDYQHCMRWMTRAENFLSRRGAGLDGLHRQFARLAGKYELVVKRLLSLPQAFIHGEFYPSNVLLRGRTGTKRVCPIDWEVAALGPSLIDLAALTSGTWTPPERKILIEAYRETLESHNGWPPPLDQLLQLVDVCRLHLAVQWLGWAADWSPPQTHAQNWLNEALRLADHLSI